MIGLLQMLHQFLRRTTEAILLIPISLTSIVCKVMEHVIYHSVMEHFQQHQILNQYLYDLGWATPVRPH